MLSVFRSVGNVNNASF